MRNDRSISIISVASATDRELNQNYFADGWLDPCKSTMLYGWRWHKMERMTLYHVPIQVKENRKARMTRRVVRTVQKKEEYNDKYWKFKCTQAHLIECINALLRTHSTHTNRQIDRVSIYIFIGDAGWTQKCTWNISEDVTHNPAYVLRYENRSSDIFLVVFCFYCLVPESKNWQINNLNTNDKRQITRRRQQHDSQQKNTAR